MIPRNAIFRIFLLSVLCAPLTAPAQQHDTIQYALILTGNIKGEKKVVETSPGAFESWYHYNDRGRGDSVHTIYREDKEGFPTYAHMEGVDYYKKPLTEDFSLTDGVAKWKNKAENESKTVSGKAFYIHLDGESGNLIKALKANHNKITLLPSGECTLEEVLPYKAGDKSLHLCRISGMSMTPAYVWVDDQDISFGVLSDWFSAIRKGYEKYVPELLAAQKKIERAHDSELAKTIPEKVNGDILIRDVTLFDAEKAALLPHTDVLVGGGKIKAVSVGKPITAKAARIVDGSGQTLLPGFWDMHVHMGDGPEGLLHLAAGVTHVRDMGNDTVLLTYRKQIDNGQLIGPHLEVISGLIDGAGPTAAPTGMLINNVEEGKKFVRLFAAKGYDQIKLYSTIKPEWVKPLIAEAKKYHMRVCGHIPAYMTATQAIEAGYNEVTHMNMLFLNFFGDTIDTRTPQRFAIPAQRAASLDLNSAPVKQFIALMKQRQIASDPTLVAFEPMMTGRDGVLAEKNKTIIDHFPVQIQPSMRAGGGGIPVPPGMDTTYIRSFDAFLKLTKLLYDNGIRIVAGTDGTPGFDYHRELELYVKAGIPAEKVLQLATFGTAEYTGKSKDLGSIRVGKKADMILVAGDPVKNISNVRHTKLVLKDGVIYDPAKLYKAVSIQPF
ncbi:amidohydrolase family protein [Chitinophaga qingshengii]|uniref:Amidohydrolase family protein n=1 Tax=Chitinophaga qingshengii TaxID=1569794 RepID=A0ABR7TJV2_9BACT|nr:amidohydrolase family protein [Chitinophaga qingshengii]MBC9930270.1 amidohydrolase family protein [Chitinophaga qingshengii]